MASAAMTNGTAKRKPGRPLKSESYGPIQRPAPDWYAEWEIRTFLGIDHKTFDRYRAKMILNQDWVQGKDGGPPLFHSGAILRMRFPRGPLMESSPAPAQESTSDDANPTDPQERFRLARARQEEVKLAEMKGDICRIESVRSLWQAVARIFRECAERLQRSHGNSVSDEMNRAVDDADREVRNWKPC